MKYLLPILLLISVCSCKKAFVYKISGIPDTTSLTDSGTRQFTITITSRGTAEQVILSADSIPSFSTLSFNPSSGTPPFTSVVTITGSDLSVNTWGIYHILLHSKAPSSHLQTYNMYLAHSLSNPTSLFTNGFSAQDTCNGHFTYALNVIPTTSPDTVYLTNFLNIPGDTVLAAIQPYARTIVIPAVTHGHVTISGGGSLKGSNVADTAYVSYLLTYPTSDSTTASTSCFGIWYHAH